MKNTQDLSTQKKKKMFDICTALSTGLCPPEFQNRNPGSITQSRWLTTASKPTEVFRTVRSTSLCDSVVRREETTTMR